MNREKLGNGNHADVYFASDSDKFRYPKAEVVREERTQHRDRGVIAYLRQGIAHSMFPQNILPYLAFETEDQLKVTQDLEDTTLGLNYLQRTYSELAVVPEDHAVFASHLEVEDRGKEVVCGCDACVRHDAFHRDQDVDSRARKLIRKAGEIGIKLPYGDVSDYCLSGSEVLFFEVDDVHAEVLRRHLESEKSNEFTRRAGFLLDALEVVEGFTKSSVSYKDYIL